MTGEAIASLDISSNIRASKTDLTLQKTQKYNISHLLPEPDFLALHDLDRTFEKTTSSRFKETSFLIPSPEKLTREKVIWKGIVMRYRPTFSKQGLFIDRYLELTNSMLRYYGKVSGSICGMKPIFRIPVSQISQVSWIDIAD